MVQCPVCSREVASSNLGRGYFAPMSTQRYIPPGSVNEYQLRLGRQRQVWLIPIADETHSVQVKLCYSLTVRDTPHRRYTNRQIYLYPFLTRRGIFNVWRDLRVELILELIDLHAGPASYSKMAGIRSFYNQLQNDSIKNLSSALSTTSCLRCHVVTVCANVMVSFM